jgi:NAD(P)H-quinone oxidoreductase subunit 6
MVGAIVLARRDYLPDEVLTKKNQAPVLTLPERPREVASIAGESSAKS